MQVLFLNHQCAFEKTRRLSHLTTSRCVVDRDHHLFGRRYAARDPQIRTFRALRTRLSRTLFFFLVLAPRVPVRRPTTSKTGTARHQHTSRRRTDDLGAHISGEDLFATPTSRDRGTMSTPDQDADVAMNDNGDLSDTVNVQVNGSSSGNGSEEPVAAPAQPRNNADVPKPKRLACMICRKRKLRCDGNRPRCSTCTRLGHDCAYDEVRRKSGPKRGYVKALEERLSASTSLLHLMMSPASYRDAVAHVPHTCLC